MLDYKDLERQAKCRQQREVKDCMECIRYRHCFLGEPLFDPNNETFNELQLTTDIVMSVAQDYCLAYELGDLAMKTYYQKFLLKYANFLTCENIDGQALVEKLDRECLAHYGEFKEKRRKRKKGNLQ